VELQPLPLLQILQYTTSNATRATPVSRGNTGKELSPQYFHLSGYGKHHSRLLSFLLWENLHLFISKNFNQKIVMILFTS